jgi:glycosyltransferase involved in cell wall biosynthesis
MKKIKPLLFIDFNSTVLSGGNRRIFEFLKRGRSEGIDYIIVTSLQSCKNASKMFPDYMETLSNYKVYVKDFQEMQSSIPGLKQVLSYGGMLRSALLASEIAVQENVDLIVGGEEPQTLVISYLAGKLCSKPWTAVFQPFTDLLQPSSSIGSINAINVLKFVSEKPSAKNLSLVSRIGMAQQLFFQLKAAQKSLMLSVSSSVVEELQSLNPQIKFHVIEPGNGIDLGKFATKSDISPKYDAIFFARLVPEKGLYDLPFIWKHVIEGLPKAVLAVAGLTENQRYINRFLDIVTQFHLGQNIIFLGEQKEDALISAIRSSKLTLYPSLLDSFSLVTLESLACSIPVVAYDIPAIRHNFGRCSSVVRCPIGDRKCMAEKTLSIIKNEELREGLSKKAKEYSSNYDWQNVVKAEKQAYLKVIQSLESKNS